MLQILLFSFPFQLTPSRRATKSGSVLVLQWEFQLTPSRRATSGFFSVALIVFNFNSRPHGGRRGRSEMPYDNAAFQLTPSRRATREHFCFPCRTAFQLTPSRRATIIEASAHRAEVISTHALTEGDILPACILIQNCIFQLTPSRRATLCCSIGIYGATFQLTPSRRATDYIAELFAEFHISTHALTEGD